MLTQTQRRDLLGLTLIALAAFLLLSVLPVGMLGGLGSRLFPTGNVVGVLGRFLAGRGWSIFGPGLYLLPFIPGLLGAALFGWLARGTATRWALLLFGLALLIPTTAALITPNTGIAGAQPFPDEDAGWVGRMVALPLLALLGWLGAALAVVFLGVVLFVGTIGWNPVRALARARGLMRRPSGAERAASPTEVEEAPVYVPVVEMALDEPAPLAVDAPASRKNRVKKTTTTTKPGVLVDTGNPESSDLPPLHLLAYGPKRDGAIGERELDRLGRVLLDTLRTFKVEGQIVGRTTGPVVTQFEVVPAPGIKVNRIASLDADLALALKAASVRIVAPIPGKGAVGVEVPNPEPDIVSLREILESAAFQRSRGQLPVALGKDLTGKPYVADLAKMPHLLIAGTTGSGKSVCINTIITSLIYRYPPKDLRMLMVDPKMVELSMYGALPHLRHPVVTNPNDAAIILKWAVFEMERRYALLSENGARSLAEFNRRATEGVSLRKPRPHGVDHFDPEDQKYTEGPLPFIVLVVDELADLMMAVQAEIERPLAQLAQKARAIGIHLIVATQRPSVNVITGLIKANFPCRIGFRVSSKVDSRTILDQNGADALLGNGDMLFLPPGTSDPVRIQGCFLSTEETERLMDWYRSRESENWAEEDILEVVRAREAAEAGADDGDEFGSGERDEKFRQAAEICTQAGQGSTSLLQRRLKIGYGRAARIIDQLHAAGVLGPPDGSKPREVLVGPESLDHIIAPE